MSVFRHGTFYLICDDVHDHKVRVATLVELLSWVQENGAIIAIIGYSRRVQTLTTPSIPITWRPAESNSKLTLYKQGELSSDSAIHSSSRPRVAPEVPSSSIPFDPELHPSGPRVAPGLPLSFPPVATEVPPSCLGIATELPPNCALVAHELTPSCPRVASQLSELESHAPLHSQMEETQQDQSIDLSEEEFDHDASSFNDWEDELRNQCSDEHEDPEERSDRLQGSDDYGDGSGSTDVETQGGDDEVDHEEGRYRDDAFADVTSASALVTTHS